MPVIFPLFDKIVKYYNIGGRWKIDNINYRAVDILLTILVNMYDIIPV